MNFLEILFYCCKRILIWQKILEVFFETLFEYYFLNIIVNVKFFSDLKFECYCEYYPEILLEVRLKEETKIDGRDHEIFSEKVTEP